MEGVEGIKKLLLGGILARDKLHIVHHQHIHIAVFAAELGVGVVLYGVDKLVCKGFAGNVGYAVSGVIVLYVVAYCVHKVGFAKADVAVYKEGIVCGGGVIRHRLCGGGGDVVAAAYNEIVKCKFGIKGGILPAGFLFLQFKILIPLIGGNEYYAICGAGGFRYGGGYGRGIEIAQGIQSHVPGVRKNKRIIQYAKGLKTLYPELVAHRGHALFYYGLGVFPELLEIHVLVHVTNPLLIKLSTLLITLWKITKSRSGLLWHHL